MTNINTQTFAFEKKTPVQGSTDGTCVISMNSGTKYLVDGETEISQDIAKLLVMYAKEVVKDAGMEHILDWNTTVITLDDAVEDELDRSYCVDFKNPQGTRITLVGIFIIGENFDSFLNHGFEIICERKS